MRSYLHYGLMILILLTTSIACQSRATTAAPAPVASQPITTITFACRDFEREYFERQAAEFHAAQLTYQVQVLSADELVGGQWDDALRILANHVDTFTDWAPATKDVTRGSGQSHAPHGG